MLQEMKTTIGRLLPRSAVRLGRNRRSRAHARRLACEPLERRQMLSAVGVESALDYVIVDTGQTTFHNNANVISAPSQGQAFYGQDARYQGNQPSYALSAGGLTVYDNNTDLTWTKSPDLDGDGDIDAADKLSFSDAQAYAHTLNAQDYGGHGDWRLPSIKELYSLIDFSGVDPSGYNGTDTSGLVPFIDTDYFDFDFGDTGAGERVIDAQYWSSTGRRRSTTATAPACSLCRCAPTIPLI